MYPLIEGDVFVTPRYRQWKKMNEYATKELEKQCYEQIYLHVKSLLKQTRFSMNIFDRREETFDEEIHHHIHQFESYTDEKDYEVCQDNILLKSDVDENIVDDDIYSAPPIFDVYEDEDYSGPSVFDVDVNNDVHVDISEDGDEENLQIPIFDVGEECEVLANDSICSYITVTDINKQNSDSVHSLSGRLFVRVEWIHDSKSSSSSKNCHTSFRPVKKIYLFFDKGSLRGRIRGRILSNPGRMMQAGIGRCKYVICPNYANHICILIGNGHLKKTHL